MGNDTDKQAQANEYSNLIIELAYCGGCGWSLTAKKLHDSIKKKNSKIPIDCRPQNQYTGLLKGSLLQDRKERTEIYSGNKDQTAARIQQIAQSLVQAYLKR